MKNTSRTGKTMWRGQAGYCGLKTTLDNVTRYTIVIYQILGID